MSDSVDLDPQPSLTPTVDHGRSGAVTDRESELHSGHTLDAPAEWAR